MMNDRITLRRRVTGQDAAGQPAEVWEDLASVWSRVLFQTGAEAIRANAETSIVKVSIRIRRRSDLDTSMRAAFKGVEYDIKSALPDSQDVRFMFLVCEATK